jgi:alkanesulfonate monooxygenase SsuD/methylene tetrahydromethanopterin reductase-like flavin-dependent oxidoreductase (luciferase family)
MAAATLAALRPGCFTLGISHSGADNLRNNGIPTDRPIQRLLDYLLAITAMLRTAKGQSAEFHGRYYQAWGTGYGLTAAELPIIVGGFGRGMSQLAAQLAQGMVFPFQTAQSAVRKQCSAIKRLRPAGSPPFFTVTARPVAVHQDEGVALRRARAGLTCTFQRFPASLRDLSDRVDAFLDTDRFVQAGMALPEELVRSFVVVTTPGRMKDDLLALDDAEQVLVGVQQVPDPRAREAFGFSEADEASTRSTLLEALFA